VTYDWEDDDEDENSTPTANAPKTFVGFVTNGVSYAVFALAVVAFYSLFAVNVGFDLPALAWYSVVLPEITTVTPSEVVVNVSPAIAGVVAAVMAILLR